jgi:hypothetical protein
VLDLVNPLRSDRRLVAKLGMHGSMMPGRFSRCHGPAVGKITHHREPEGPCTPHAARYLSWGVSFQLTGRKSYGTTESPGHDRLRLQGRVWRTRHRRPSCNDSTYGAMAGALPNYLLEIACCALPSIEHFSLNKAGFSFGVGGIIRPSTFRRLATAALYSSLPGY